VGLGGGRKTPPGHTESICEKKAGGPACVGGRRQEEVVADLVTQIREREIPGLNLLEALFRLAEKACNGGGLTVCPGEVEGRKNSRVSWGENSLGLPRGEGLRIEGCTSLGRGKRRGLFPRTQFEIPDFNRHTTIIRRNL